MKSILPSFSSFSQLLFIPLLSLSPSLSLRSLSVFYFCRRLSSKDIKCSQVLWHIHSHISLTLTHLLSPFSFFHCPSLPLSLPISLSLFRFLPLSQTKKVTCTATIWMKRSMHWLVCNCMCLCVFVCLCVCVFVCLCVCLLNKELMTSSFADVSITFFSDQFLHKDGFMNFWCGQCSSEGGGEENKQIQMGKQVMVYYVHAQMDSEKRKSLRNLRDT